MDQICAKTVKIISRGLEAKKDQIFTWFQALITNFSKNFRIWTLKCQNWPILAKIGPNLGPNSQNQIKCPRKQSKTTIPHLVQPLYLIFHKIVSHVLTWETWDLDSGLSIYLQIFLNVYSMHDKLLHWEALISALVSNIGNTLRKNFNIFQKRILIKYLTS